jgi:hypothetical protein
MPNKPKDPYILNHLEAAKEAVMTRGWTVCKASKIYKVPRTTLFDHTRGRFRDGVGKMGRTLALDQQTENSLVKYCIYMAQKGFPLTRKILGVLALQSIKQMKVKNPFSEAGPSRKWVRSFLKRHTLQLSLRTPDHVDGGRAALNQVEVDQFFNILQSVYDDHPNITSAQVYNCDETGFSAKETTKVKVIAKKGQKRVYLQQVKFTGHTTVLMAASAAGDVLPPFVIHQESCPSDALSSAPSGWKADSSKSGWITTNLFQKWFEEVFIPNCTNKAKPALLLMDNHVSHLSATMIDLANKHNIILLCLPPHSSHILQPLDKGYFNLLKQAMANMAVSLGYGGVKTVPKQSFTKLLQFAMAKISNEAIKSSFRATGVYPLRRITLGDADPDDENAPDITEDNAADPPCSEGGKKQIKKLVKLGIIPEYLTDILLPPPPKKVKNQSKARLSARILNSNIVSPPSTVQSPIENATIPEPSQLYAIDEVQPGPSTKPPRKSLYQIASSMSDDEDDETCCVCDKQSPPGLKKISNLQIINWARCSRCRHWTHLKFCSDVQVVSKDEVFLCPHCTTRKSLGRNY